MRDIARELLEEVAIKLLTIEKNLALPLMTWNDAGKDIQEGGLAADR